MRVLCVVQAENHRKQWMSGCGEDGAQEGVHIRRVGFLGEAVWHLEAQKRTGFIRLSFQKTTLLPQLCPLPSGRCFHEARVHTPN